MFLPVAACGGSGPEMSGVGGDTGQFRIAVVPKGTSHDFWKAIHVGALRAEQEFGNVEVIFRGP